MSWFFAVFGSRVRSRASEGENEAESQFAIHDSTTDTSVCPLQISSKLQQDEYLSLNELIPLGHTNCANPQSACRGGGVLIHLTV